MLRWVVNVQLWNPSSTEFDTLLRRLPKHEQECCLQFKFDMDRKRALISRFLQRRASSHVLKIPFEQINIQKTKGKKPFVYNARPTSLLLPNFNFNVAHEGHFAVLVSEPVCLCGVDVSAPHQLRHTRGLSMMVNVMERVCTESELSRIRAAATSETEMESLFQRHWALKEAFVKARGDGLSFGLKNAEFCFGNSIWSNEAKLKLKNLYQHKWVFHLHQLQDSHWVAVAKGPPNTCKDEYGALRSTLQKINLSEDELNEALGIKEPSFDELSIADLTI